MLCPGRSCCARTANGIFSAELLRGIRHLASSNPIGPEGVISLVNPTTMAICLRSRKNYLTGEVIERECSCHSPQGVSVCIPPALCPVHVLWPKIAEGQPGDLIFPAGISRRAAVWLKVALAVRGVPNGDAYALHSLRRSPAREIAARGGSLATILKAGWWRSAAFHSYLDLVGVERKVFAPGTDTLVDLDLDPNLEEE